MHDELAEQFSLLGAKGKRAFKTLLFANAILGKCVNLFPTNCKLNFEKNTCQENIM